MKAAIISYTENGRLLSERIAAEADFMSAERYCYYSHTDRDARSFVGTQKLTGDIFTKYEALIFVCASGIAVRAVAPYLRSKQTDPAVIVIDDCGRFVIPILSGHLGGANVLALLLSELIDAQAVITTATDTGGRFSPDSFAKANDLLISDMQAAKSVAAAVLDGETVGFVSDYEYMGMPDDLTPGTGARTGIYVGCDNRLPFPETLKLIPRNIVLGIGCRRGADCESIEIAVRAALASARIPFDRVERIATIDLKADERGLIAFCRKHGLGVTFCTPQELMETEGDFTRSHFVRTVTGADNVCERSAVRCSGGKLIIRKTAHDGVTVAAAERPVVLDFEKVVL
ncbi:MAG: cobalt-precorrin 5A hydrolase [Ruminococcus sp.]|nr:cobalt-precorrin 5A hydrolase [Ruminococcus sp.]